MLLAVHFKYTGRDSPDLYHCIDIGCPIADCEKQSSVRIESLLIPALLFFVPFYLTGDIFSGTIKHSANEGENLK